MLLSVFAKAVQLAAQMPLLSLRELAAETRLFILESRDCIQVYAAPWQGALTRCSGSHGAGRIAQIGQPTYSLLSSRPSSST